MRYATAVRRSVAMAALAGTAFAAAVVTADPAAAANSVLNADTKLYVNPVSSTLQAGARLQGSPRADAQLLGSFPSASWFTNGTPAQVRAAVKQVVDAASAQDAVPTLVVYFLPFRDCSQYSAGGALSKEEYKAWIDGFAEGVGRRKAVILLEPDGLGIIPHNTDLNGNAEWCRPAEADPATAVADRYEQFNYAVDKLKANPNAAVYLDGTHSAWLGVGDISNRLVRAGVLRANGFFLNASNYESTPRGQDYGSWISQCIYYANNPADGGWRLGQYGHCASQYYPANPNDYSTWGLSRQWYLDNVTNASNPPSSPRALPHFVLDTSRNGRGSWAVPPGTTYPDAQTWCNPPDRGTGLRPSANTGLDLLDAYLWIKVPGESDGQCDRGTGTGVDPARGYRDPAAGAWFVQQAAELVALADPPLARQTCDVSYTINGSWAGGFSAQVQIRNTGNRTVRGWTLDWTFAGKEKIVYANGTVVTQDGQQVSARNLGWNKVIAPGETVSFGFIGLGAATSAEPLLFTQDGAPCTSQ